MIAVDTNVLVRYYIDDDHAQHKRAKSFIDANEVFVNNLVLLETFWVLTSAYRLSNSQVCEVFDHLKRLSNFIFENKAGFSRAMLDYRDHGCDFADALLGAINRHYGCSTVSFDRQACKTLGFELL